MRAFINKAIWLVVHKPPWKPILIWGPWVAIILVLAFYGIENWRGQRALDKALKLAKSKGYSLDWQDHIPEPIPEENNLAYSKIFDDYEDGDEFKTTLHLMKTKRASSEISTDSSDFRKPRDRFLLTSKIDIRNWLEPSIRPATEAEAAQQLDIIHQERKDFLDELYQEAQSKPLVMSFQPLDLFRSYDGIISIQWRGLSLAGICEEDARLACTQGDIERALSRIAINNTSIQAQVPEVLVDRLIDASIAQKNNDIAEHILRSGSADSAQLKRLDDLLSFSLIEDLDQVILAEMSCSLIMMEHINENRELLTTEDPFATLLSFSTPTKWEEALQKGRDFFFRRIPSGWLRSAGAENIGANIQQIDGLDLSTLADQRLFLKRIRSSPTTGAIASRIWKQEHYGFVENSYLRLQTIDTQRQLMRIATQLELFHLEKGRYPNQLAELKAPMPQDFFANQDFHYTLKEDGTPHLWSIGFDEVDNGGFPRVMSSSTAKGDLVWMLTPIPGLSESDWRRALR